MIKTIIKRNGIQTRKKYKYDRKLFNHTNTMRRKKPFNLHTNTLRKW